MPIPVSEILNPTPPASPPTPAPPPLTANETTIVKLLRSRADQGFTIAEIRARIRDEALGISREKPLTIGNVAMAFLLQRLLPKEQQTAEEALKTLLEKGHITTHKYNEEPHYWASETSE